MRYTFAFCLASARQLAQPMPELPPVTITVLPATQHYNQVWHYEVWLVRLSYMGFDQSCVMHDSDTDMMALLWYRGRSRVNAAGCVLHGSMGACGKNDDCVLAPRRQCREGRK